MKQCRECNRYVSPTIVMQCKSATCPEKAHVRERQRRRAQHFTAVYVLGAVLCSATFALSYYAESTLALLACVVVALWCLFQLDERITPCSACMALSSWLRSEFYLSRWYAACAWRCMKAVARLCATGWKMMKTLTKSRPMTLTKKTL